MILQISDRAKKQLKRLPQTLQEKSFKQFSLLIRDFHHPSLRSRKQSGSDIFETRIDIHYRFTFTIGGEIISILTIGMHDTGLGKK